MDLEAFFDKIDVDDLQAMVTDSEQENLHLEFKTVKSAGLIDRDDKKNFAKALSGFSNANGGLIIWGIRGDKNDEGIDCASDLIPIDRVSVLLTNLETHTGQWVDPQIKGVRHKIVHVGKNTDRGCVISLVPESDSGPHMSSLEGRYYTRSGSSFYRMTHSQVADRFFRRRAPKLALHTSASRLQLMKVRQEEYIDFRLIIGVKNSGKAMAKYPYLSVKVREPYVISHYGLDGNGHEGLRRLPRGNSFDPTRWGAGMETVIHPGSILEVTTVVPPLTSPRTHVGKDVVIEYEICAEDAETVSGTEVVSYSAMEEALGANQDSN